MIKFLSLAALTATVFTANPAAAFNDWYKQGFADGTIYVQQNSQQQIQQLEAENWRLRQQIAQLTEQQTFAEEQMLEESSGNEDILASLPRGGDDLRALRRSLRDD